MSPKYFGTDGIRGVYGGPVINEVFFGQLGFAATRWLKRSGRPDPLTVLIGRDTRSSGEPLANALAAGLASAGAKPLGLGILPSPVVARAVRSSGAALGAMITASHNPSGDNGVKFFAAGGRKLSEAEELEVEGLLRSDDRALFPRVGCDEELSETLGGYRSAIRRLLPERSLEDWRIVGDAANGAAAIICPDLLRMFGADVIGIGNNPNGFNINEGVGSEHPERLVATVKSENARLGIAVDGDGDRCVLCDEQGGILDGDEILTILAKFALERGELENRTLVVTVHSNLGVDAAVSAAGGRVVRTAVGDRHVAERMALEGATLGGESSGHIIFSNLCPVGDGFAAAIMVIRVMLATGRPLSELRRALVKFPQASSTVPVREKKPLESLTALGSAIREIEAELGPRGRILVRYSGTEPKLRLLVEGPEAAMVKAGLVRLEAAAMAEFAKVPRETGKLPA